MACCSYWFHYIVSTDISIQCNLRSGLSGRSRDAITHLTGRQAHGVRLDLSEAGDHYDIVVWSPK